MSAISLRQFLQSLCFKSPWNYAMFWKLHHQYPAVLTWGDGYFNIPCGREPKGSLAGNCHVEGLNELSSNFGSGSHNGNLGEHPIGLAMAEMSSTCHIAGKGVVGEVAFSCIPRWISSDHVAAAELGFGSTAEYPDEWLLQFVAGIKTILLIPCIPHGVLQLGSMETVTENVEVVTNIAEQLYAHFKCLENVLPGGENFPLWANLSESLDIVSAPTTDVVNQAEVTADNPILEEHKFSTVFPLTSSFEVQDAIQIYGKHMPNVMENTDERKISAQHADVIDIATQLSQQYSDDNGSGITENSLGISSCHARDVDAFSYSSCSFGGVSVFSEVDLYLDGDMLDTQLLGNYCDDTILRNLSDSLNCPTVFELQKALESTIQDDTKHYINNLSGFCENTTSKSIHKADHLLNIDPSFGESNGCCHQEDNVGNLLEAVVASACCTSDDYSPYEKDGLESLDMLTEKPFPSAKKLKQSTSAKVGDSEVTWSTLTSASAGTNKYGSTLSSHSAASFDCLVSEFNEGQDHSQVISSLSHAKESKVSNSNKKRGRSGDILKPRPRDRQLIQDRLKELRQLVPNGAKCSIDGLLDKTIKHMLFLRSVTDQADKLRGHAQNEVSPEKSPQSPETKNSYQQGTCWALELGSEEQICPIIVKDLECPGQMLIEMMCDDHGRFLEIADVIHRLELTILKGVMEKHSESTWAHFIVEATGSFHRLDIFWPLMQLIQQVPASILRKK